MASIKKRSTASGDRWDVRWRDGAGKPCERAFRLRRDAEALKRKVEGDELRGLVVDVRSGDAAFGPYAEAWIPNRLVRGRPLAPRTVELYESQLRRHLLPTFAATRLRSITPAQVRTWHAEMTRTKGSTTAAKCYRLLRAILATAVGDELIGRNPAAIKGAGQEHAPERPMASSDQVEALASAVDPQYRALVLLAAWCSLRLGELLALRRDRVDLLHRTLTIADAASELSHEGRVVAATKSEAGKRVLAIPPHIVPVLEELLSTWVGPRPDAPLFCGPRGGPLRRATWRKQWDEARIDAGFFVEVPDPARPGMTVKKGTLHLHDMRHFGGTKSAQAGATTKELMSRLGHATPRAALIYQHATAERDQALAERLSALAEAEKQAPVAEVVELPRDGRGMPADVDRAPEAQLGS